MAQNELHLKVTLRIYSDDDQRCFGPGIATLLQRVREHHSLRAGAASMEMAYSKAWRIIRTAETVFGCKLLSSTIGGARGGGAVLPPEAERRGTYAQGKFEDAFRFYRDLDHRP